MLPSHVPTLALTKYKRISKLASFPLTELKYSVKFCINLFIGLFLLWGMQCIIIIFSTFVMKTFGVASLKEWNGNKVTTFVPIITISLLLMLFIMYN